MRTLKLSLLVAALAFSATALAGPGDIRIIYGSNGSFIKYVKIGTTNGYVTWAIYDCQTIQTTAQCTLRETKIGINPDL